MGMRIHTKILIGMMVLLLGMGGASRAEDLGTVFSYQGRLETAGSPPLNGSYDFQFRVYDTPNVGTGTPIGELMEEPNVLVTEGIFTVQLNPDPSGSDPNLFNGEVRYLEIAVRKTGSAESYFTISPRQRINAAPYAITSSSARWLRGRNSTKKVVYVDDAGNVGIGTTNPRGKLEVSHDGVTANLVVDSNGNVGIGTTDPGVNRLKVAGDIDITGALKINNKKPIKFIKYIFPSNVEGYSVDSGISYDEYAAAIVGFSTGYWDINENGPQYHIRVYPWRYDVTGTWLIYAYQDAHGSGEYLPDWIVWVMYVHMSLVEDLYGY
jgi:hypothetical protein